ncbi:MAG: hypothetical protein AAGF12_06495 [Myxococcota bacterium]
MLRKSRHGLTRCPACGAHVRAAATPVLTVCPFCNTNIADRVIRRPVAGRGALVAASLLSLSASCGGAEQEPVSPDDPVANTDNPDDSTNNADNTGFDPNEPDDNVAVAEYGAVPDPAWDPDEPEPVPAPEYGAPAEEEEAQDPTPDVPVPAYGAPPPREVSE